MQNSTLRRYVDIFLYAGFCFVIGSGLLIGYRLAPCSRGGDHGQTLLGMDRHAWGEWHLWVAYAMMALLVVHLILNFKVVMNVVVSKNGLLLGILSGIGAVMVLFFLFAPLQKEPDGRKCGDASPCATCPSAAGNSCPSAAGNTCPSLNASACTSASSACQSCPSASSSKSL